MPTQAISGDISQMETQHGYGVVREETIGPGATLVRVLRAKVVRVTDAIPQNARKRQISSASFWRTRR